MAVLGLIAEARAAGLILADQNGTLVIRGPGNTASIAQKLGDLKAEVLLALAESDKRRADPDPPRPAKTAIQTHRLIGCGFPPVPTTTPPKEILANPIVLCAKCNVRRVLPEPRSMTGTLCYPCWMVTKTV